MNETRIIGLLRDESLFKPLSFQEKLSFSVGNLTIELQLPNGSDILNLKSWYEGFTQTELPSKFVLQYLPLAYLKKDIADTFSKEKNQYPEVTVLNDNPSLQDNEVAVFRWDMRALLNLATGAGHVFLLNDHAASVDAAARIAASLILPLKNQLLVHGSSIEVDGKGYCFLGRSGSGKSTISQISGKTVLNDEISLIGLEPDGSVSVSGTPFYGDLKKGINRKRLLKGFYVLSKDKETFVYKIDLFQQHLSLMQCVISYSRDIPSFDRITGLCKSILNKIQLNRLYFEKNRTFLEVIQ